MPVRRPNRAGVVVVVVELASVDAVRDVAQEGGGWVRGGLTTIASPARQRMSTASGSISWFVQYENGFAARCSSPNRLCRRAARRPPSCAGVRGRPRFSAKLSGTLEMQWLVLSQSSSSTFTWRECT